MWRGTIIASGWFGCSNFSCLLPPTSTHPSAFSRATILRVLVSIVGVAASANAQNIAQLWLNVKRIARIMLDTDLCAASAAAYVRGGTRPGRDFGVEHGQEKDDPSAPQGLNSQGVDVSLLLARRGPLWGRAHPRCRTASNSATAEQGIKPFLPYTLFATKHPNLQQNRVFAAPYARQSDTKS